MSPQDSFPSNDISLENLSNRAINVCLKASLNSTGKVLEYFRIHGTFIELQNCGLGTERELVDLCAKYGQEPTSPENPFLSESLESYRLMRINYLKPYITHSLFNELISRGIETIGQFYDMNFREFALKNRLSSALVERLRIVKTTIHNRPDRIVQIIEAHGREIKLPSQEFKNESVLPHDFLGAFEQVMLSFLALCKDDKADDVIIRRFGLSGTTYTLKEIGGYFNKSRELIRQIEKNCIEKLNRLLFGNGLNKPFCSCEVTFLNCINQFRVVIIPDFAIDKDGYLSNIVKITGVAFSARREALLGFLQHIFGIEVSAFNGRNYILGSGISAFQFELVARGVIHTLSSKIIPIDLFDLIVTVKKSLPKKEITNDFIQGVVSVLPEVFKRDDGKYEIELVELSNIKDKAYRILFEKQDALPFREIWREIAHRTARMGIQPKGSAQALVTQMVMDSRFAAIGKSGVWGLSEWNLNTDTLIQLISTFLHSKNSPVSSAEILNYVKKVRPRVEKQSIHGLLHLYTDTFIKITDGRYILKDWAGSYDTRHHTSYAQSISHIDLFNVLKGIFQTHGFKSLASSELLKALQANNIPWGSSTFDSRIRKCVYLKKMKSGGKNYYSFDPSASPPTPLVPKRKTNLIITSVNEILSHQKEPVPLSTIIHKLCRQGHRKGTIYKVIAETPEFIKTSPDSVHYLLSLSVQEKPSIVTLSARVSSLLEMIKDGESSTVEFKSSLRWDRKFKTHNPDLEFVVAKTIAGFLNTRAGTLFIGVDDNCKLLGLTDDYKTFKKENKDGFLLHFNNVVIKYFSKEVFTYVLPAIEILNATEICVVSVEKSRSPVYLNNNGIKEFYIRVSNATHRLDLPEVVSYVRANWDAN